MVGLKQEFRQSQNLVMTHQLQQSIKLLQLSAVELQEYIDAEMEKNPLLQRDDNESSEAAPSDENTTNAADTSSTLERADADSEINVSDQDYSVNESLSDEAYSNDWAEGERVSAGASDHGGAGSRHAFDDDDESGLDRAPSKAQTLREKLLEQIHMDITSPSELLIAERLVDMVDEAGYLRDSVTSLAQSLGATETDIEQVIERLQQCEPVGVFARSLKECLGLQLKDMDRLDPAMQTMLNHLEMIGSGELPALRKRCGVDEEDFALMLADIRRCNPKPGSAFAYEESQAVIPDVLVRKGKGGTWLVELNNDALPRVLLNRRYAAELGKRSEEKETKKFINEHLANANWLIKALDQRAQTVMKVAQEIVKQQEMFLLHGIRFLKPLVLKDIAAAISMHESTISRVTTSKFMATPRGTLEMKYFFTSSINSSGGQNDFSSKTVMYYIKELIAGEEPKAILSDDAIVKRLQDRNIDVARRTVTKYREEMGIPSSVVRRRQKSGAA